MKKISLKKLVKIAKESKGVSPTARSTPSVKGITVGEKHLRDKESDPTLIKKGKSVTTPPKKTKIKTIWRFKEISTAAHGEGTSANPGTMLGMMGSPSVAEKLLTGVIPPSYKEKGG